jgi:hypothetical protein
MKMDSLILQSLSFLPPSFRCCQCKSHSYCYSIARSRFLLLCFWFSFSICCVPPLLESAGAAVEVMVMLKSGPHSYYHFRMSLCGKAVGVRSGKMVLHLEAVFLFACLEQCMDGWLSPSPHHTYHYCCDLVLSNHSSLFAFSLICFS